MPVDIDDSNLPRFPQKLTEKLIQIRERSGRTWNQFAPQVNARDWTEIAAYENNGGDLPISVLYAYARCAGIPVENIIDDDRDLWFGHRQDHERSQTAVFRRVYSHVKDSLALLARGLPLEVIAGKKRECEAAYNAVRRRQLRPTEQWSYQAR